LISAGVADPDVCAGHAIRRQHLHPGNAPLAEPTPRPIMRRGGGTGTHPAISIRARGARTLASCCVADIRIAAPGGIAPAGVCKTRTVFENMVLHIYDSVEGSLDAGGWCASERA